MKIGYSHQRRTLGSRFPLMLILAVATLLVLAACSGPGGSDDPTPTPTSPPVVEPTPEPEPSPTPEPEPTATSEPEPTATATEEPEPTATATAEPEPTATPEPEPTATATATPVPVPQSGGAEFRIEGKPVVTMYTGDDDGGTLFAITDVGISRTDNAGRTWFASGDTPDGNMIVALNTADVLYAGERGSCGMGPSDTPLTRSTDGGRNWETFAQGEGIEPYLVEAGQQSIVIGADCGLHVSTNGGQAWEMIPGSEGLDFFQAASSGNTLDDRIIAVGVTEGGTGRLFLIDMSDPDAPAFGDTLAQFWAIAAIDWVGDRIVAATASRVGVSDDNGATWAWFRNGLEDATYSVDPLLEGIPQEESNFNFIFDIARIDPSNPDRIWIGGPQGAYFSSDAGNTWRRVGDRVMIDSIVISTDAERVFVSAAGGTRVWTLDGQ